MATQSEIASRMVTQLRLLDPSISAAIGTPERKIIDTVAQVLAESQVDINMLNGAFDIEAKYGSDLDHMLSIFGFGRQQGTKASGFVTFTRTPAASNPIVISAGTQILAPGAYNGLDVGFITSRTVTLAANNTSVIAPVECLISGEIGNVSANTITSWNQTPLVGITAVNNDSPIVGGTESESDESLKARFKTSGPFRNLAGTQDQFLALALSTFSTKANVVGPVSRYSEYVQVPLTPDSQDNGNGSTAASSYEYTTALSTNNHAKYIYTDAPYFVSDTSTSIPVVFNQDFDYYLNIEPFYKNRGDAYREYVSGIGSNPLNTNSPTIYQPNVTFNNIYTGVDTVHTIAPGDILLLEYAYLSSASRNDYLHGVLNCVDIFVNGSEKTYASTVIARPNNDVPVQRFNTDQYSALYYENFRRVGKPNTRPLVNNIFIPLYHQPMLDLPDVIPTANGTYIKNIHYWAVEDYTLLRGTVRARNGIEFSSTIKAKVDSDNTGGPYTGQYITDNDSQKSTLLWSIGSGTTNFVVVDSTAFPSSGIVTIDNEKILYTKDTAISGWSASNDYYSTTLSADATSSATTMTVASSTAATGMSGDIVLVDSELIQLTTSSSTTLNITTRGYNGSTAAAHTTGKIIGNFVYYGGIVYQCISTITANVNNSTPDLDTTHWSPIGYNLLVSSGGRGYSSTIAASHTIGSQVSTSFVNSDKTLSIDNYIYDANIVTLQAALEGSKQVTTDVLAHKAKIRYFKPDVTIMYAGGSNPDSVNESIRNTLSSYFDNQYFGSVIQLSDILQIIHNVTGVDNVRWSKDVLGTALVDSDGNPRNRLTEVDESGNSLNVALVNKTVGDGLTPTSYVMYFADTFTGGSLYLSYNNRTTSAIPYIAASTTITTTDSSASATLSSVSGLSPSTNYYVKCDAVPAGIYITTDSTPSTTVTLSSGTGVIAKTNAPVTIYNINPTSVDNALSAIGLDVSISGGDLYGLPSSDSPYQISYTSKVDLKTLSVLYAEKLTGGIYSANDDFSIADDELVALPTGTLDNDGNLVLSSSIVIRRKTQNTWNKV